MDTDLERRVEKLENTLKAIIVMAKQHPMGKMFLDMLGLDE